MTFDEHLDQILTLLQRDGRITYQALKRRLEIDDEYLADLTAEIIEAKRLAIDEDGKVLVWVGEQPVGSSQLAVLSSSPPSVSQTPNSARPLRRGELRTSQSPISYTPAHLADRIRAVTVTDGERKTITALFADLKGSTALIEGLDPEEARAIIDPALQVMMDAVHRYEGYVAQALGDGIFALFGAPIAHEDHPQRALYAALRMQETLRRHADSLRQQGYPPLLMRVGINTGEVVVRSIRKDDLHADYVPVGHSTNLAARMEQLATPGSIVVSAYTHRLTEGYFTFKDLGPTQIKGVTDALNIYELLGVGQLRTRLQVSASRSGLTRFIGRRSEMDQLNKALEQAKAGHGQIVGVMGEAGLGKSRLFYEHKFLSLGGCLVLEAYSVSHGKATAYLPVIELLKSYFEIKGEDDERKRQEKVTGKVLRLDRNLEDTLPYLFALLGIEEQPSPLAQMDAQIRRKRTFETLKKLFLRESLNQPLVLIFEDLHWIDGETQGFLDVLSESIASAKILLLTNYRPEYRHEWGQKTYYMQLRLAPFGKEEAEEFLDILLGVPVGAGLVPAQAERPQGAPLQDLKYLILDKTQGTPFFMEEIVQELREQGVLPVGATGRSPLHIPPTVQGVLAARIDRLTADEKTLLQQLAVIGRQFPLSLIRQVVTQPEADLYRLLTSLQRKEFLYEQPAFPEVEYTFKHALTQEVAYNSVLIERRKALHEQTAQAMERLFHERLEEHYDELAHHYTRSGNTEKAIEYLYKAGQQAVGRSANTEAINHLTIALELLKTLPDTPQYNQQELTLQLAVAVPLSAIKGYTAPEVEIAYRRAYLLSQQADDTRQFFPALRGLEAIYTIRGELRTVGAMTAQKLALAQREQDPALLLVAHYGLGVNWTWRGQFPLALDHLRQSLAHYDPDQHRRYVLMYAQDPKVFCLMLAAINLWLLGYPDQAVQSSQEGFQWAQELSHPTTLAVALSNAAWLHQLRREPRVTQERAEATTALCTEYGLSAYLLQATNFRGWALALQQQSEEGIGLLLNGIDALQATGVGLRRSHYLALLAEAYGGAQRPEEGLALLPKAFASANKNEECWYDAELYRLKGELTLQKESKVRSLKSKVTDPRFLIPDPQGEAEACFLKAIAIAQKQQAKSLELRAVMSLVRLRQQQAMQEESRSTDHAPRSRLDEARSMLSTIYNWFTEGFDTKDLQEAKVLLAELEVNEIVTVASADERDRT